MDEELPIKQLVLGEKVRGAYRGFRQQPVPAVDDKPEVILARVFLDIADARVAIEVDQHTMSQVRSLDMQDGDPITIERREDTFDVRLG
jgi:hypothetical protein